MKSDGTIQAGFWENGEYLEMDNGFGFADGDSLEISAEAKNGMSAAQKRTPRKSHKELQRKKNKQKEIRKLRRRRS